jgi:hypothetical protein
MTQAELGDEGHTPIAFQYDGWLGSWAELFSGDIDGQSDNYGGKGDEGGGDALRD